VIDIENKVFSTVATALRAVFNPISVYGEYTETLATFPCVTLIEDDNTTYQRTQDDSLQEHHASLMYTANIYSNKSSGRKAEAKAIADLVDTTMQGMKFTRTMRSQTPNIDRSIYRITIRYTAVVEEGKTENGDIVYQIFRR
jgi:hypothetical protein